MNIALVLAAVLAAQSRTQPRPTQHELDAFEQRCRAVSLVELGHLLSTAPTAEHADVATRVATERLRTGR